VTLRHKVRQTTGYCLSLLRTVAKQQEALVGVYAKVKTPARIRIDDPVMLVD
jgi:hypothetical protein